MNRALALLFLIAPAAVAAPATVAPGFVHKAPHAAQVDKPLVLTVTAAEPEKIRRARVRYRVVGDATFDKLDMKRAGTKLSVTIPASAVKQPALEYYIVAQVADAGVIVVVGNPRFTQRVPVEMHAPIPPPVQKPAPPREKQDALEGEGRQHDDTAKRPPGAPKKGTDGKGAGGKGAGGKDPDGKGAGGKGADGKGAETAATDPAPGTPSGDMSSGDGEDGKASSGDEAPPSELPASNLVNAVDDATAPPRVPNLDGRRLPGGPSSGEEGDPFAAELAVYAAEDEGSFVREVRSTPKVAAFAVTVIERREIQRMGARTLLDVLQIMPGVSVTRDVTGFWEVALRGQRGPSRVRLLVDGQPAHDAYDGRARWDLPADMIESVEVSRGPTPWALPSPAYAGVVDVKTRRGEGAGLRVWGGSFNSIATGGGFGAKLGSFGMFGSGHLGYSEGARIPIEEDGFSRTPFVREPGVLVTHGQELDGALALGFDVDLDGTRIYGRGRGGIENRGPWVGAFDTVGESSALLGIDGGGSLGVDIALGDVGHVDLRSYGDVRINDRTLQVSPAGYFTPSRDEGPDDEEFPDGVLVRQAWTGVNVGLAGQLDVQIFEGNALKAGVASHLSLLPAGSFALQFNRDLAGAALGNLADVSELSLPENGPCPVYGINVDALGACRATTTIYVGDAWQLFEGFFIDTGVALTSMSDVELDLLTHTNPHFGVSWLLFERLTLRANVATALRAPTFAERLDQSALSYIDFSAGAYVGEPTLVPEAMRVAELGFDYTFELADAKYTLWATSFAQNVESAIDRIDTNGNVEKPGNFGGYDALGAEGGGRATFAGGSAAFFNVSWTRAFFRAPPDLDEDEPSCALYPWEDGAPCGVVSHIPQLRANLGFHLDLGLLDLNTWAVIASERRNNARTTLEQLRPFTIDPYALLNLSARTKPLFGVVGAEASVFNLLDVRHTDDAPRPDRLTGLIPRDGVAVYAGVYLQL